jgi:hypothetical protein
VVPASGNMYTQLETHKGRLCNILKQVRLLQIYPAEVAQVQLLLFPVLLEDVIRNFKEFLKTGQRQKLLHTTTFTTNTTMNATFTMFSTPLLQNVNYIKYMFLH